MFLTPNMQTTYPHILQSMGITIGRLSTVFAKARKGKAKPDEAKRDEILDPRPLHDRYAPEFDLSCE